MQDYTKLNVTKPLKESIPAMQTSLDSTASNFSGTSFPTDNLFVGMTCYRTDTKTLYICTALDTNGTATWTSAINTNVTAGSAETDDEGNIIKDTYLKKEDAGKKYLSSVSVNDALITVQKGDGTASQYTVNNVANAGAADKLQTARIIGGVSFDGTANIDLPGVNTKGNQDTSGKADTAGTADEAKKLQTPRNINGVAFDGSADITVPVTEAKIEVTGSTQTDWNKSVTATNASGATLSRIKGIAAGEYTLAQLIQELVTKSHTHGETNTNHPNCDCDCNCN